MEVLLKNLGIKKQSLKNTTVLITNATSCILCLNELKYWNKRAAKTHENIALIIVDDNLAEANSIINSQKNNAIPVYYDSTKAFFKNKLGEILPVKVYLNKMSKPAFIYRVGSKGYIAEFLNRIQHQ